MAKDKSNLPRVGRPKAPVQKKVLGVRIPKVRGKMDWLLEAVESELGRRILADVLVAAAAAAAAALVNAQTAAGKAGKEPDKTRSKAGRVMKDVVRTATDAAAVALANSAKDILTGEGKSGSTKRGPASTN